MQHYYLKTYYTARLAIKEKEIGKIYGIKKKTYEEIRKFNDEPIIESDSEGNFLNVRHPYGQNYYLPLECLNKYKPSNNGGKNNV
ncbi:MAG: hypothetical protein ACE5RH_00575 [Nitrosarchaeum sp.]